MDIPRQVDKKVRQEITNLNRPWQVIKKRDHYFLHAEGKPPICLASNASKQNEWLVRRSIEKIRKLQWT